MAAYWPKADARPDSTRYEKAYAPIWRDTPKIVFSRTLESADWNTRSCPVTLPPQWAS